MARQDVLKVFIGTLHSGIDKPALLSLCRFHQLNVEDVIVPKSKPNKLAIAFLVFNHPQEAAAAITVLNGLEDETCSPGRIHVFRGAKAGYLYVFRSL